MITFFNVLDAAVILESVIFIVGYRSCIKRI